MESQNTVPLISELEEKAEGGNISRLTKEVWQESKKLWEVVGPAAFMRLVLYAMNIISQAFAGHLGDRELAAYSIATTVVSGLSFGLLVRALLLVVFVCSTMLCQGPAQG